MGYMHINNLYKDDRIFQFTECYAMEKIHGTSAHITWKHDTEQITLFPGGEKYENFAALFDQEKLKAAFREYPSITVFGEAYGGKCQGMSGTYGKELKFIIFDVRTNDGKWFNVPDAELCALHLGLDFVDYARIATKLSEMDEQRKRPSTQAIRNGIMEPKEREGIVLRPIEETEDHRGNRIITKHKNDSFKETKTQREVDPEKLQVLADANKIADEWVTEMRLQHVLDKSGTELDIKNTPVVIRAMVEDVRREAAGEIIESKDAMRAIGLATARLFKKYLNDKFTEAHNV